MAPKRKADEAMHTSQLYISAHIQRPTLKKAKRQDTATATPADFDALGPAGPSLHLPIAAPGTTVSLDFDTKINDGGSAKNEEAETQNPGEEGKPTTISVNTFNAVSHDVDDDNNTSPIIINDASSMNVKNTPPVISAPIRPTGKLNAAQKAAYDAANQAYRAEQLEWIIITKENNLPNTYGSHSTTTGPLQNPQVASLYGARYMGYGKKVTGAAISKRYLHGRQAFYDAHPTYPRAIVYAGQPSLNQVLQQHTTIAPETPISNTTSPSNDATSAQLPDETKVDSRYQANFFGHLDDLPLHLVEVTVVSNAGVDYGTVFISKQDLQVGSELYNTQFFEPGIYLRKMKVNAPNRIAVERYASCLEQGRTLPAHDFGLKENHKSAQSVTYYPTSTPIDWDFEAYANLYLVATAFKDDAVRNLVLHRWYHHFQRGEVELYIAIPAMNNFFDKTETDDVARNFWLKALYFSGAKAGDRLPDGNVWHEDIVEALKSLEKMKKDAVVYPWHLGIKEFCRDYHYHDQINDCYYLSGIRLQRAGGRFLLEYKAIVVRLLYAKEKNLVHTERERIAKELAKMHRSS
ncbi:hypothetical protein P280DRAFT_541209 [Massarina eburnea CBS 473.64]|uniref:Uncharacterized protein n=1 Tax=Massarina eburnea CBS 473.64 TaxID=1395130 RepID=A0A6A6S1N9_9PLEO|nr:hypothetical protein P280DRAFT_541209 [Massarina eburnea CBS 473.64]